MEQGGKAQGTASGAHKNFARDLKVMPVKEGVQELTYTCSIPHQTRRTHSNDVLRRMSMRKSTAVAKDAF